MLVALAILAVLIAMLPGSIRLAGRAAGIGEELERQAAYAAALTLLERRIAEAMPIFEKGADGSVNILFRGSSDRLDLVSPAATGPDGGGIYRSVIEITPAARPSDGTTLVLRQTLFRPGPAGATDGDGGTARTLFVTRSRLQLRYFGSHPATEAAQWHDAWERLDALPRLVELAMPAADARSGAVRSLVVATRLGIPR